MRQLPPIPPGWRLLGPEEPLSRGDKWFGIEEDSFALTEWRVDRGLSDHGMGEGRRSDSYGSKYRWITPDKGKTIASAEKEWLNPWD